MPPDVQRAPASEEDRRPAEATAKQLSEPSLAEATREWHKRAAEVMAVLIRLRVPFTADDLRALAGEPPRYNWDVAAVFGNHARWGRIECVGGTIGIDRRPLKLWRGVS